MIVLLVIDMQVALFEGEPARHDAEGVIHRINALSRAVRAMDGKVIFIQHDGTREEGLEPGTDGWHDSMP